MEIPEPLNYSGVSSDVHGFAPPPILKVVVADRQTSEQLQGRSFNKFASGNLNSLQIREDTQISNMYRLQSTSNCCELL
jgi:hypothetical protein